MEIKKLFHLIVVCLTLMVCLGVLSMGLQAQEPDAASQSTSLDETEQTTQEEETHLVRVAATGTGGPDDFGYTYIDSNEAGGPTYDFVDLPMSNSWTLDFADDSLHGPYALDFNFNYYGIDYNQIWISSDGWLSLGSTSPGDSDRSNDCALPSTNGADNIVAGIWDDLEHNTGLPFGFPAGKGYFESFTAGSCPYNGYSGACAVTEWDGMFHASGQADPMTFEILLFDNQDILIQIADDGSEHGASSTTGIENATGQVGLTYACNSSNSLGNSLAIQFSPPAPSPVYAEEHNYAQAPYYVETGQRFTYTLVISNTGDTNSSALLISDTLPSEVTQIGAATVSQQSASVSGSFVSAFPAAGSAIQWSGRVPASAGLEIQIPVQINSTFNSTFVNTIYLTDSAMSAPVTLTAASEVYRAGELFLYQSFNESDGGLSGNNEWEWGQATYGPKQAHSPNGLWGLDLDAEYDNNLDSRLTMTIDLTTIPSTHTVMLHWWEWVETQSCCDFGSVKISSSSNPIPTTISGPTSGDSGGWVERVQDISSYAGELITLNFLFEPNLTVADKGWFIDDIFIRNIGAAEPAVQMEKTVSTDPTTCASTDLLTVSAGTTVYYCYQVTNSGTITLNQHSLVDSQLGSLLSSSAITLTPGSVTDTRSLGHIFSALITTDTVNSAVWTASDGTLSNTVTATNYATVTIGYPAIALEKTVGTSPTDCATSDSITVTVGTIVYYCYRVTNIGDMSLDFHSLNDSLLGIAGRHAQDVIPNLAYTLDPGESFTNVDLNIPVSHEVNTDTVNSSTWSAYNAGPNDMVTATDTSTVTIGYPAIALEKTVGTSSTDCATSDSITVTVGTVVYYCYRVTNIGDMSLDFHSLNDSLLGIAGRHAQDVIPNLTDTLDPGESFTNVDLNILVSHEVHTDTVNSSIWSAYNAGPNDMVTATDTSTVTIGTLGLELSKTVGTQAGVCANTDVITVSKGTEVYYCYQVTNTGQITLGLHTLNDGIGSELFNEKSHQLAPGENLSTLDLNLPISTIVNTTTTNTASWTAYNVGPTDLVVATDTTTVVISNPIIELKKSVGTQSGVCATTETITVTLGTTVYYCYEVTNHGNVPLALHTLDDTGLGSIFSGFAHDLAPGESLNTIQAGFNLSEVIQGNSANVGTWTAYNNGPTDTATAVAVAQVFVNHPRIELNMTVGTQAGVCATTDTMTVTQGTTVYYCYEVTNTGEVSFTLHTLEDNQLGNLFTGMTAQLQPGETINNISAGIPVSATISANTSHLSTWTAYNNGPTNVVTATDSTLVIAEQIPLSIEMSTFTVKSKQREELPLKILIIGMMLLGVASGMRYGRDGM